MVNVLLVNTNLMKPPIAPIGLDYLAGALAKRKHKVDLLDLCFAEDPRKEMDDYFRGNSPEVIGVTIRNTDDCYFQSGDFFLPKIKEITEYLKRKTEAPLVLGGVGFSLMPEEILSYCDIDLGIRGDGEVSLPLLVERIVSKEDWRDIPGLVWRENGKILGNPPGKVNLDEVVLPERGFVDNRRYFKEGGQGSIETKRGCGQKCIYCADPIARGREIRLRSPGKVAEEMRNLLNLGVDCLHTCDSEFNLPEEHAKAVCEEIIRQKLNSRVKWYTYCSPAPFSEELARLMKKAGCAGIDFGVDSGSHKILKILKRNFGIEEIKNTAKLCHKYGITFMYDLLLGGPGETRETIKKTISLMKEISPDRGMHQSGAYRVGVMLGVRVYPGTQLAGMINKGEKGDSLLFPTFYVSPELGEGIEEYIANLIGKDERFFFPSGKNFSNYNYNQNEILIQAIKEGYRGAYWDILRLRCTQP